MSRPRNGFTLAELAVALAVGGLVVAAGHAVLTATIETVTRARRAADGVRAASTARAVVTEWLRAAVLVEDQAFYGIHRAQVGMHIDELSFNVSDGGSLHPGPRRVTLWVERSPTAPRQGFLAAVTTRTGADTLLLAPGATDLALRYLIVEAGRERWVREWQSTSELPVAIELRVSSREAVVLGATDESLGLPALFARPVLTRVTVETW